jgi:hypothetical protein
LWMQWETGNSAARCRRKEAAFSVQPSFPSNFLALPPPWRLAGFLSTVLGRQHPCRLTLCPAKTVSSCYSSTVSHPLQEPLLLTMTIFRVGVRASFPLPPSPRSHPALPSPVSPADARRPHPPPRLVRPCFRRARARAHPPFPTYPEFQHHHQCTRRRAATTSLSSEKSVDHRDPPSIAINHHHHTTPFSSLAIADFISQDHGGHVGHSVFIKNGCRRDLCYD